MASSAAAMRLFGTRKPLNIMLAVTDRCSAGDCLYCVIPERKSPEMPLQQILKLIEDAASSGCQRLGIWGGEPLIREDIGEVVAFAKKNGIFVTIDTNGHLVIDRYGEIQSADHFNISLEGDSSAHDILRGEGNFDRVMEAMEYLKGRSPFWTITVLTRHNLDQVDWLLKTAEKIGFLTTFQVLHHNDLLGRNESLYPDAGDLRETLSFLIARKREGAPIASSLEYLELLHKWPDFRIHRKKLHEGFPSCMAGFLFCNIDVNGEMYPCSVLIGKTRSTNVVELGFKRAFQSLEKPPCSACIAGCYTEYNLLYSLNVRTGLNWVKALRR